MSMRMPKQVPYSKEIMEHQKKFPDHQSYEIFGTNKKEKLRMPWCRTCKKVIGTITVLSSKRRRR